MDLLAIFALVVLITLLLSAVAFALWLGWLPGHIAHKRGHPQAAAITACGWLGLLTMGILLPVAFVWAYLKPVRVVAAPETAPGAGGPPPRAAAPAANGGRAVVVEEAESELPAIKGN